MATFRIKPLKIHFFQHVSFEGLGSIAHWSREKGHMLSGTPFYNETKTPPVEEIDWLVVMGGPMSIKDEMMYPWLKKEKEYIKKAIDAGKVVIGICLGAQLVANALGAKVYANPDKEIGWFPVNFTKAALRNPLFSAIPEKLFVFHWHSETFEIPDGAIHLAKSEACSNQGFLYNDKVLGLQFHMEMSPDNILTLYENCKNEITEGEFIQSYGIMENYNNFTEQNKSLFNRILNKLEDNTPEE